MQTDWTDVLAAVTAVTFTLASWQSASAEVEVQPMPHGAIVTLDHQPFAEYLTRSGHQPAVWPIIGPTGKAMTRAYPIGPRDKSEATDHPHHRSLWFTHGDVNGHDFWTEPAQSHEKNEIKHREFVTTESGPVGKIVTRNDWISNGKKICEDQRTLVFGQNEFGRYIDFTITITASEGDVTFGDTKEGTFAVRAAAPLTVSQNKHAQLVNSRGMKNAKAWGMFAEWIDDSGILEDEGAGIAMFNHPDNFRHPTRWHIRTYGLLAANPFGEHEFPPDKSQPKQGAKTIPKGESLTLRYRVLLHEGDADFARLPEAYKQFSASKQ